MRIILVFLFVIGCNSYIKAQRYFADYMIIGTSLTYMRNSNKDFYKKHKTIMHLWTYLGPTSELTFLIITAMFNRMDIYLIGIVTVGNVYMAVLYFFQNRINKSTKLSGQN